MVHILMFVSEGCGVAQAGLSCMTVKETYLFWVLFCRMVSSGLLHSWPGEGRGSAVASELAFFFKRKGSGNMHSSVPTGAGHPDLTVQWLCAHRSRLPRPYSPEAGEFCIRAGLLCSSV